MERTGTSSEGGFESLSAAPSFRLEIHEGAPLVPASKIAGLLAKSVIQPFFIGRLQPYSFPLDRPDTFFLYPILPIAGRKDLVLWNTGIDVSSTFLRELTDPNTILVAGNIIEAMTGSKHVVASAHKKGYSVVIKCKRTSNPGGGEPLVSLEFFFSEPALKSGPDTRALAMNAITP